MKMPRVAIFDSGVGGLTVAKAVVDRLPGAHVRYLGDTARLPYGTKSAETVTRYALQAASALLCDGAVVDAMVVACNTASSCALPALDAHHEFPVLGVIDPGARRAVEATLSGKIGVIGTERTIASRAYHQALKSIDAEVQVFAKETPLLVGLAEEGWFDGPVVEAALRQYLTPWLQGAAEEIDTLVLGCTHYPALKGAISQCVQALLGREITLIDSAEAIADDLAERLPIAQVTAHPPREIELLATDALERFERVGGLFFPTHTAQLRLVDL